MAAVILKPGREKSLMRRHPWVFSGAIADVRGKPGNGETVDVFNSQGSFVARAAYSPNSQIAARVWTWDEGESIDAAFFSRKLSKAIHSRDATCKEAVDARAVRLVYAEADGLPGLIVDRFGETLVVQLLSAGAEYWRETLANQLVELTGITDLYERSDVDVRRLEALPERTGVLRGSEPPEKIIIEENGLDFSVDIRQGHKTGHYLDQRRNRFLVGNLAKDKDVLDCFCYTGGFSLNAYRGEARSILAVDASENAIARARENFRLNQINESEKVSWLMGDVFHELRLMRDKNLSFDLIILDPPKFAPTANQLERAARGYKDINLLAFKLLRPGGILVTFSCSGGVSEELFQKIVAGAALDAHVEAQIVQRLHQSPDHPVSLSFPESAYLKGFIIRVG